MKYIKLIITGILLMFFSCSKKQDRKVVTFENQEEHLTIIHKEDKYLIFNGLVLLDSIPTTGYVVNEGGIEYFSALVIWKNGIAYLYHQYGSFNESQNNGSIVLEKVTTKQFENLKKQPGYNYFYY